MLSNSLAEHIEYVRSVEDFLAVIEFWRTQLWDCAAHPAPRDRPDWGIFRGQGNISWPIKSKIARLQSFVGGRPREEIEVDLFDAWVRRVSEPKESIEFSPKNRWEWLACAQHYGLDTRLLDWTTNPLNALFFACACQEDGADGVVWGMQGLDLPKLNPDAVETNEVGSRQLLDVSGYESDVWFYRPGRSFSSRINAQDGCFTVQRRALLDLREALELNGVIQSCCIQSISIRSAYKSAIITQLRGTYSTGFETLFPDATGLARQIRREYLVEPE